MIGNAHLDPVWLWPRQEGIDAVLATARSACDRLDEYPPFVFTCSGSWFHEQIERLDPTLFERVRQAVRTGRWQLVGGMHVQPDCNLPSEVSFARQLQIGQGYYQSRFGRPTTVGYNVDSFGHTAYMPRFLRQGGIDSYCFLRPGPGEMPLPASVFRWRSPDGFEVIAQRIAAAYTTGADDLGEHVARTLSAVPPHLTDIMCFYGVGDHGGGPTRRQIEWIARRTDAFPGARLVMSHPRAFFDAVASRAGDLPAVGGELQHHAIGCYSVDRRIKVSLRQAEHSLQQAQACVERLSPPDAAELTGRLDRAWRSVAFNEFHDILGGTSLPDAGRQAAGELIAAASEAEDVIVAATRPAFRDQAVPGRHRIIVFNPSEEPFDGYVEFGPWASRAWRHRLTNEAGADVPVQVVDSLARMEGLFRLLWNCRLGPGDRRVFELSSEPPSAAPAQRTDAPVDLGLGGKALTTADELHVGPWSLHFEVLADRTDTWSHSAGSRFSGRRLGCFRWRGSWRQAEAGPLRWMLVRQAEFSHSRLWCRLSTSASSEAVRLDVRVTWAEALRMLRLRIAGDEPVIRRTDLVSGGPLPRPADGREYPLGGGIYVEGPTAKLAVAAPDVFSAGVCGGDVNFTLLRSPYAAWHDPTPLDYRDDSPVTDQGSHEFHLLLWPAGLPVAALARHVRRMSMPPLIWEVTG